MRAVSSTSRHWLFDHITSVFCQLYLVITSTAQSYCKAFSFNFQSLIHIVSAQFADECRLRPDSSRHQLYTHLVCGTLYCPQSGLLTHTLGLWNSVPSTIRTSSDTHSFCGTLYRPQSGLLTHTLGLWNSVPSTIRTSSDTHSFRRTPYRPPSGLVSDT